jgi:peptide/nickel transport system substrate-binding protein
VNAAKKLVADAGASGKSVVIKTYADDPYPALATILQDALTSIGFKVTVQQMERSAFIDEVTTKGDFEIGICRWAAGTTDMDEIWYGSLDTDSIGASGNWSWYSNPELDKILEAAGGETDVAARKDLYKKAIDIFNQDVPQIPLYYPNGSRAYSKNLKIADGLVQYNRMYDYSYAK